MMDWWVVTAAAIAAIIYGVFVGRAKANRLRNVGSSVGRGEKWGIAVLLTVAVVALLIVYLGG